MPHIGSCALSTPHQMPPGGLGRSPSLSPCLHKRLETPTGTQRPPLRPFPAAYTGISAGLGRDPSPAPVPLALFHLAGEPPSVTAANSLETAAAARACRRLPGREDAAAHLPGRADSWKPGTRPGFYRQAARRAGSRAAPLGLRTPNITQRGPSAHREAPPPMPGSAASCCLGSDPPVSVGVPRWGPQPQKWGEDLPLSLVGCAAPCSELRFHPAPSSRSQSGS